MNYEDKIFPDIDSGAQLEDYPNLTDLTTSNIFSNRLLPDQAASLAFDSLDAGKRRQLEELGELDTNVSVRWREYAGGAGRKQECSKFMGLLTFT